MVLWQAGAVAALVSVLVSVLGAGAVVAAPLVRHARALTRLTPLQVALDAFVVVFALVVVVRLTWSLVTVARLSSTRRRRHRWPSTCSRGTPRCRCPVSGSSPNSCRSPRRLLNKGRF